MRLHQPQREALHPVATGEPRVKMQIKVTKVGWNRPQAMRNPTGGDFFVGGNI